MNRATRFPFALRALAAWLALVLMLAASAPGFAKKVLPDGGGADPEVEEKLDEAKDDLPKFEPSMATVRGSVFYNDRRIDGLFGDRRDLAGNPGVQCKKIAAKPDCSSISKRLAELRVKREAQVAFIADFKGGSVAVLEEQLATSTPTSRSRRATSRSAPGAARTGWPASTWSST